MGLKRDYRQYRSIVPICRMLNLEADFILLTNNPDKVEAMKGMGFKLKKTENLEYQPSPYNLAYLKSKKEAGHILELPEETERPEVKTPEVVIPFKPYALKNAQRFIYTASYFLPIRPIDDELVITGDEFQRIFKNHSIDQLKESKSPLILSYDLLRNNRYRIKIHKDNLKTYSKKNPKDPLADLIHIPYWFRVHVYFDIITDEEFVVLTYGKAQEDDIPIVRIHSEALFNRFPLVDPSNKEKYKSTIKEILNYGVGVIVHLYSDGRGAGLGAYAQDMMFTQQGFSASTMESYLKLGISYDLRDYEAAMILLKEHLPTNKVQMVMNSPSSLVKKTEYTESLNKTGIDVDHWIFLEEEGNK